jgi:hypothetical protein
VVRGRGFNCLSHGTALNIGTVAYRAQKHGVRLICICDCVIGITLNILFCARVSERIWRKFWQMHVNPMAVRLLLKYFVMLSF